MSNLNISSSGSQPIESSDFSPGQAGGNFSTTPTKLPESGERGPTESKAGESGKAKRIEERASSTSTLGAGARLKNALAFVGVKICNYFLGPAALVIDAKTLFSAAKKADKPKAEGGPSKVKQFLTSILSPPSKKTEGNAGDKTTTTKETIDLGEPEKAANRLVEECTALLQKQDSPTTPEMVRAGIEMLQKLHGSVSDNAQVVAKQIDPFIELEKHLNDAQAKDQLPKIISKESMSQAATLAKAYAAAHGRQADMQMVVTALLISWNMSAVGGFHGRLDAKSDAPNGVQQFTMANPLNTPDGCKNVMIAGFNDPAMYRWFLLQQNPNQFTSLIETVFTSLVESLPPASSDATLQPQQLQTGAVMAANREHGLVVRNETTVLVQESPNGAIQIASASKLKSGDNPDKANTCGADRVGIEVDARGYAFGGIYDGSGTNYSLAGDAAQTADEQIRSNYRGQLDTPPKTHREQTVKLLRSVQQAVPNICVAGMGEARELKDPSPTTALSWAATRTENGKVALSVVAVGDCSLYVRKADGTVYNATEKVPRGLTADDPGGSLGMTKGLLPNLDNLTVLELMLDPGDEILTFTDGVTDNIVMRSDTQIAALPENLTKKLEDLKNEEGLDKMYAVRQLKDGKVKTLSEIERIVVRGLEGQIKELKKNPSEENKKLAAALEKYLTEIVAMLDTLHAQATTNNLDALAKKPGGLSAKNIAQFARENGTKSDDIACAGIKLSVLQPAEPK